ncbi:MAG: ShlB/FhaC/HecB family hemolysin secretion/activation protein [Sphingomonadaceae bacterium]|nr:ShlB/FhaC/HecB family hemolysin secretion/activation protein [Sphingomonadaceae bacterium]
MRIHTRAAALAACASLAAAAAAQPGPDAPLIIDRDRVDRLPAPAAAEQHPAPTPQAPPPKIDAEAPATRIARLVFDGVEVPARVAQAAKPFLGQPASRETLGKLAAAMSDAYGKANIALYTIQIPAQDLSSGVVHVQVAEGFIENIVINGDTQGRHVELIKAYAERMAKQRPLTRRVLERYLSLIRDIPGLKVDANLMRGFAPGGVVLVLTLKWAKDTLTAGLDNHGTELLGVGEGAANAKLYHLFREGDETDITAASAIDLKRYRYAAISHSTPIGRDGLRLSVSGGYLTTRPRHTDIHGDAETAGVGLSYPIVRGYKKNLVASASIDGTNSNNAALGSLIATERTRAARVALAYSDVEADSTLTLGGSASRGLDFAGARVTAPLADTVFTKLTARAEYDRAIGKHLVLRVRGIGQYSWQPLPAAERMVLGGPDYGRAFDTAILTGDSGYAGSGELAWRPALPRNWMGSELYGFVDGGSVHLLARGPFLPADYDLASAGAGVRLDYLQKGQLDLELAHSIDNPYPSYRDHWRFSVGWSYDLR